MKQEEIEKIEIDYYNELEARREIARNFTGQVAGRHSDMFGHREIHHMVRGFLEGYQRAAETLFTKEQVREAIILSSLSSIDSLPDRCDEIIQSLKK